jgi:drug/metabolite transporter (DMT)-like permease
MLPAFLTTFLWSICVVAARRSVDQLGEDRANLYRILLATGLLGAMAHTFGGGLGGAGLWFFFLSGIVGFGFGDIGAYNALSRIGSRLTILIAQCGAVPVAGFAEWMWMGTTISLWQLMCVVIIVLGIVVALMPERARWATIREGPFLAGIAFGVLAALGQGLGAVLSRRAYEMARAAGELAADPTTLETSTAIWLGATAGYQRLLGGVLIIAIFTAVRWRSQAVTIPARQSDPLSHKATFVGINALTGPVLGIICFQWALSTTPSVIVQPIIALTPIVVIPLAAWLERDRPTVRSVAGGALAVLGALLLALN